MPSIQIDGVHLADIDAEDAAILRELARRGPGRLLMPPTLSSGKAEPFRSVEVAGEQRPVVRKDWFARLALHFPEDTLDGQPIAANDAARLADCAACGGTGPAGHACQVCNAGQELAA